MRRERPPPNQPKVGQATLVSLGRTRLKADFVTYITKKLFVRYLVFNDIGHISHVNDGVPAAYRYLIDFKELSAIDPRRYTLWCPRR